MLASRRTRLAARAGVTLVLLAARVGGGRGDQALALVRGQRLIFGPFVAQIFAAFFARHWHLRETLVVLARLAALLGGELRPELHAARHALLLLGLHARVALGDGDPFLAPLRLEGVPVGLERRE